jgi:hypothetical protein
MLNFRSPGTPVRRIEEISVTAEIIRYPYYLPAICKSRFDIGHATTPQP